MEMLAEFKFAPTEQEVMFARCLARSSDYAKAWLDAGYEDLGHTKNYTRGITLAKKRKVSERLEFFKSELIQKADIKDYEIINGIKSIAFSSEAKDSARLMAFNMLAKMSNLYERNNQANAPKIVLNLGRQEKINVIDVSEG